LASDRSLFEDHTLIEAGTLTHDEVDALRPGVFEAMARAAASGPGVRFVKVHDAYSVTVTGEALLAGARAAKRAIVIVRDPRDVAPSLAYHNGWSIDGAIAFMNWPDAASCWHTRSQAGQLRQRLFDWSGHVRSWMDQTDIPVHVVRYEDLHHDPATTLLGALSFAGYAATRAASERAVRLTDFKKLQACERETGFDESPTEAPFFRRGVSGLWRDDLSSEQVQRIEAAHGATMQRLGYQLTRNWTPPVSPVPLPTGARLANSKR
jgi:aryl sulfotransferase